MKKSICILLAAAFLAAGSVPAMAGGRGGHYYGHRGPGIGGFFAGLVGGAILGTIIANSQPAVVYAPPPPAYVPPAHVWVPGRYETRYRREWVPGYWATERRDDVDRRYYDDDSREGRRVWVPGHYENVREEVWLPGHWEERG